MENALYLHGWGGGLPDNYEEAWGKCVYMGEEFKEDRVWTAVYGRLVDITELKAPVDIRSGNKKWFGPQGNDHRFLAAIAIRQQ
jgi:hypothetical protein